MALLGLPSLKAVFLDYRVNFAEIVKIHIKILASINYAAHLGPIREI